MFSKISTIKVTASAIALCALTGPALADWNHSVIYFGQTQPGLTGQVECPTGGTPSSIWGTGTYTSDSSICGAAQHFGWLTPGAGGTVFYRTVAGLGAYEGSTQNGVTSSDYGSWDLSFQITGVVGSDGTGSAETIAWNSNADSLGIASDVGQTHTYICPPYDGTTTLIAWGTGIYSSDSSICTAAMHYGRLNPEVGGPVNVQITGEQTSFVGTQSFGYTSSSYGAWPRSYTFQ